MKTLKADGGFCIWLTGLSGAGKTTISEAFAKLLDCEYELLDGDVVRTHISKGLGFSKEDRDTNIERIGWIASKIVKFGGVAIVSAISPHAEARRTARTMVEQHGKFIEVHVHAPVETCIECDPKGLYKKALSGEIKQFTGVSDIYEYPETPELTLRTCDLCVDDCVVALVRYLMNRGLMKENKRRALYIGRWQPFHNGHAYIVDNKLKEGVPVAIGVRDTPATAHDPYTMNERLEMIRKVYAGQDVIVFPIPDIESVNIGREVGYAVNRYESPKEIEGISATSIRKMMEAGDDEWVNKVPFEIAEFLRNNR